MKAQITTHNGVKIPAYHCDDWYYDCPHRGKQDIACTYRDRKGFVHTRSLCTECGVNTDGNVCWHCIEHRPLFRRQVDEDRRNSPVRHITPFHAKDTFFKTHRAYKQRRSLLRYLEIHTSLYGVNMTTGNLVFRRVKAHS